MNITLRTLLLGLLLSLLIGCATGARKEGMTYSQSESQISSFDTLLAKQIEVTSVNGGGETNPLLVSEISNEDFLAALKGSLESHGLMSEDGRFDLEVNIVEVNKPMAGLDFTVSTNIDYVLVDSQLNRTLIEDNIVTKHTAKFSDAFLGVKRMRLANEGAAKNSIKSFIEHLADLDLSSGHFPIKKTSRNLNQTETDVTEVNVLIPDKDPYFGILLGISPFDGMLGVAFQEGHHSFSLGYPNRVSYQYYKTPYRDSTFYGLFFGKYRFDDSDYRFDGIQYSDKDATEMGFGVGYRWQWQSGLNLTVSIAYMYSKNIYSNPGQATKYREEYGIPFPGVSIGYKF